MKNRIIDILVSFLGRPMKRNSVFGRRIHREKITEAIQEENSDSSFKVVDIDIKASSRKINVKWSVIIIELIDTLKIQK